MKTAKQLVEHATSTTDRKVTEYAAVARRELARITAAVACFEKLADPTNEEGEVTDWADVNEIADLVHTLKEVPTRPA